MAAKNPSTMFVWRDKNVLNSFNESIFDDGEYDIFAETTTTSAITCIRELIAANKQVYVITNGGDNAEDFVRKLRNEVHYNNEIVVFCSAVDWHKKWASKYSNISVFSGRQNLKRWVDSKRGRRSYDAYDEKKNEYSNNASSSSDSYTFTRTGFYDIYSKNSIHYVNAQGLKENLFKISSKSDLKLNYRIKSKAIRDESGYGMVPITSQPIITMKLDVAYSKWTESYKNAFLADLANELGVKKDELTLISSSRGSINASVVINAVQTQYGNTPITFSYVEGKRKTLQYAEKMKKYCIKSTKIESWFNEKEKTLNKDSYKELDEARYYHLSNTLNKTEKWILHQTKSLRTSLQMALSKLKKEFVVDAICILDNDEALNEFTKHSNMDNSKLLFHGTDKSGGVLASIFRTGLRHGGGAVYGHGSYLTSSPYHSINYQILYKRGYDQSSNTFTLIAAYVNCGRIKQVYDTSYNQKNIAYPYDCHYIARVGSAPQQNVLGFPVRSGYAGEVADEYAIKDKTRILPRFYIKLRKSDNNKVVVWRDKDIFTPPKETLIDELMKRRISVYPAMTSSEAMRIINVKKENELCVISNHKDSAESFVRRVINVTEKKKCSIIIHAEKEDVKWVENYDRVSNMPTRSSLLCFIIVWALSLSFQTCNIL